MLEMQRSLDVLMFEMRVMNAEKAQLRASINPGLDRSSSGNSEGTTAGPGTPDTITHALTTNNYRLPENGA
ncbi:hypothetical protein ACHAPJ_008239 [Fusarium lateritium]